MHHADSDTETFSYTHTHQRLPGRRISPQIAGCVALIMIHGCIWSSSLIG